MSFKKWNACKIKAKIALKKTHKINQLTRVKLLLFALALTRDLIADTTRAIAFTALAWNARCKVTAIVRNEPRMIDGCGTFLRLAGMMIYWICPEEFNIRPNVACCNEETFHICHIVDVVTW